jgi:hypothetical protein
MIKQVGDAQLVTELICALAQLVFSFHGDFNFHSAHKLPGDDCSISGHKLYTKLWRPRNPMAKDYPYTSDCLLRCLDMLNLGDLGSSRADISPV